MDDLFKALADPTRRRILDLLREEDGRTLSAIEAAVPGMTRFGVMKHLKVLEAAHLVSSRKIGRSRFHYLNAAPLQVMADRWIAPFGRPAARAMSDLKTRLEGNAEMTKESSGEKPKLVYELIIRTTPADLWDAMTNPERTPNFYYDARVDADWRVGGHIRYVAEGNTYIEGEILELEPERKLRTHIKALWEAGLENDPPTRETWTIEPLDGDLVKLTVVHDGFEEKTATYESAAGGWPMILSGLKTYVETGEPLSRTA